MFLTLKKSKAGIEITPNRIRSALVVKKRDGFAVKKLGDIELAPGLVKPSFKVENITDMDGFVSYLGNVTKFLDTKKVGVAIPDAAIQIFLKKYTELPDDQKQVEEMMRWDVSNSLNLSPDKMRLSWEEAGAEQDGRKVFLVVLSMEGVISQYEEAFKKAGIKIQFLSPAGLNQFNFYCREVTGSGNVAYLGMFDEFVNIFVFHDGIPIFYKGIKKGHLSHLGGSAIDDVDLLIQYYNSEHPELELERLFIASHIKEENDIELILHDIGKIPFEILDEHKLIDYDQEVELHPGNDLLPFYTGVIGAAQGV